MRGKLVDLVLNQFLLLLLLLGGRKRQSVHKLALNVNESIQRLNFYSQYFCEIADHVPGKFIKPLKLHCLINFFLLHFQELLLLLETILVFFEGEVEGVISHHFDLLKQLELLLDSFLLIVLRLSIFFYTD